MKIHNSEYRGQRLSFFQLLTREGWKIEIPIIQRDYAQGRKSTKDVRQRFLDTLYKHLEQKNSIDLDFVYGSIKQDQEAFIPLDGQQRLTTLFLLHWYLINKENRNANFLISEKGKSNFTYETRSSSREFCDILVNYNFDVGNLLVHDPDTENSLSKTIRNQPWYFGTWNNDSTITGMLTMLDDIHSKFKNSPDFYDLLIDDESPIITFMFLNLDHFNLSDDLYIKMNARGKQLTPFENFKAKFEQFLGDKVEFPGGSYSISFGDETKKLSIQDYFAHKIDTDWTDLFWNYRDENNLIDEQLMNFFIAFIINHFSAKKPVQNQTKTLRNLLSNSQEDTKKNKLSFYSFNQINAIDADLAEDIISTLDLLLGNKEEIRTYLNDAIYYDEKATFEKIINKELRLEYRDRVRFYAFYKYLIYNGREGLESWVRVIFNLTQNTIYNRQDDYVKSIKGVSELAVDGSNILEILQSNDRNISGFLEIQIKEERIKACLIKRNIEWRRAILAFEQHGYFRGQIGFVLNFSGIEAYYDEHNSCDWSAEQDRDYFTNFEYYVDKVKAIFGESGLRKFPDYLWERALLSKGDYLLKRKSNFSFLIDDERDISWKRLLRDDNEGKRELAKILLDEIDVRQNKVENSLKKIIKDVSIEDWRKYFIEQPSMFDYLGYYKNIRKNPGNPDQIYLLKKQRMSGEHAEYYSYAFYLKALKDNIHQPFKNTRYFSPSGTEEEPCAVLDNWSYEKEVYMMKITFLPIDKYFEIRFSSKNNEPIVNEIQAFLVDNGMRENTKKSDNSYFTNKNEEELELFLNEICEELNQFI